MSPHAPAPGAPDSPASTAARPVLSLYDEILGLVDKPVHYLGQEWNQVVKPPAADLSRIAVAFPDRYEIGMSHLGLRILYDLLNRQPDLAAERVFCPAPDMEAALRRFGLPLATLETRTPLACCEVVGFSLQFEMEYTNVLTMLDLGGIPLHGADRSPLDPLVVAGGPCAFMPEPMADFIDVFVIGDGEEAFPALVRRWAELRRTGTATRQAMLAQLAQLEGCYVPALYRTEVDPETGFVVVVGPGPGFEVPFPVRRAVVDDLGRHPFPSATPVPYGEIVHDRVAIEIARGCTAGCRFCQAGILYRPVRERAPVEVLRAAAGGLCATGYDEVSLTSLSTADYSCIAPLVETMMDRFEPEQTSLSVSSLRVNGLTRAIASQLARVRRTGFTIAPEAGTQRLRDLVNKGITDADLEAAARTAWEEGWSQLKMYFMLGLPTETDADVLEIARTGIRALELARALGHRGAKVTLSASSLVPKPHSTFQWEPMQAAAELGRRQRLLLDAVRPHRNIKFKYHDVEAGIVECILSRGDRRVGRAIESAWRHGARFDAWTDHFDSGRWMESLRDVGLDPQLFLRRIPLHAPLPWDHVDTGVSKTFLIEDLRRGLQGKFSPACGQPVAGRDPDRAAKPPAHARLVCYQCGLDCDLEAIERQRDAQAQSLRPGDPALEAAFGAGPAPPRLGAGTPDRRLDPAAPPHRPPLAERRARFFYRVRYAKRGDLRWLSHLDLVRLLQRASRRAGLAVTYSHGFHPQPLFSFGPALAVGIESEAELFDFETATEYAPAAVRARLGAALPPGLAVLDVEPRSGGGPSLSATLDLAEYRAWINTARHALLPGEFAALDLSGFHAPEAQRGWIESLLSRDSILVERHTKGAVRRLDIRPFVRAVEYLQDAREVRLLLVLGARGQARPQEVLEALYGLPATCFRLRRVALRSDLSAPHGERAAPA